MSDRTKKTPKPPRVVRTLSASFQPYAKCEDCSWTYPMSANARDAAKSHAQHANHVVAVETLTRDIYEREGGVSS